MGEQRGLAPLLTVDLAPVTVELNLRESGARFPCKWSSVLEIYTGSGSADQSHAPAARLDAEGICSAAWRPAAKVQAMGTGKRADFQIHMGEVFQTDITIAVNEQTGC